MIDFALLNSFWYVTLQVHSDSTDVSFSDSQKSAKLGANLLH